MNVLIDADGCPVTDITVRLCRTYDVSCCILCDTAHSFEGAGVRTIILDKGADSVDFSIANRVTSGDLVITQDYGLAAMCLARGARILHQDGWEYTPENIDGLLLLRHESRKARASGNRLRGNTKRKPHQNTAFARSLERILQTAVQG